jgi:hypothetical protein
MKSFLVRLQPFLRGTAAVVAIFALTYLGEPSVEAQTTPELRGDVHFIDGTISTGATYNVFSGRISRRNAFSITYPCSPSLCSLHRLWVAVRSGTSMSLDIEFGLVQPA